jgi:hypothetical protein
VSPEEKSCDNCGATIPADSLFCERCGQPLGAAPAEPPYEPVTRPYEPPPRAPMPPTQPKRRIDARLLLSVIGTAVALIFLFATVLGPGLSAVTLPRAGPGNLGNPTGIPSVSSVIPSSSATPTVVDYSANLNDPSKNYWVQHGAVITTPFHKTTVNRIECYEGSYNNGGLRMTEQVYPMNSFSDALSWKSQLVNNYTSHGYTTVSSDSTSWAGNPPGNPPPPNVASGVNVRAYTGIWEFDGKPAVTVITAYY